MNRRTIREWAKKCLEALRLNVAHSTTLDEIFFGAFLGLILIIILTYLGLFD